MPTIYENSKLVDHNSKFTDNNFNAISQRVEVWCIVIFNRICLCLSLMKEANAVSNTPCMVCKSVGKSIFCSLQTEEQEEISTLKGTCFTTKGDTVVQEGKDPSHVYCISYGNFKVSKLGHDGKEQILYIAGPGDLLGYREILSNTPASTSVTSMGDGKLCLIPEKDFLRLYDEKTSLMKSIARRMAVTMGTMEGRILELAQKPVRERLAGTLLMLHNSFGLDGDPEYHLIDISLTREDLANIVGTATETIIRLISEFKKLGLVDTQGKKIILANTSKLRTLAGL